MRELGDSAWTDGMRPEIPETELFDNPVPVHGVDAAGGDDVSLGRTGIRPRGAG